MARPPRPPVVAGIAVALIAAVALTVVHHSARAPLPPRDAIRAATSDPSVGRVLSGAHWDQVTASAVDGQIERVSFFARGRIVAEVAVNRDGSVKQTADFRHRRIPYGDWIAYQPALLAGLAALFALMVGVAPLRRMRNLDVAAGLSLLGSVILLQERYVGPSVVAAAPGLGYLTIRCAWLALGPARPAQPCTPLFSALTSSWDSARRTTTLRALLIGLALLYAMVGVSAQLPVDVAYAVMEGATQLAHGVLPYGHMPGDVIHGDTYPVLSYVLYMPLALARPVRSTWDSVDLVLAAAVVAALLAAWGLFRAGAGPRSSRRRKRAREVEEAGLRAALAWLAFPPVLIAVSTGTTDLPLAAMLVGAVLLWRRPAAGTGLLAAAGWFKLAPFALMPVWLAPLSGRRMAAALAAIAAVSVPLIGLLFALGGAGGPAAMLHALTYQFSRGSSQSVWSALGIGGLQPLGQGAVLGLIAGAAVRVRRDRALAADPRRVAALAASILLALQLSADYWAFLYLAWTVPLLSLSLLSESAPALRTEGGAARAGASAQLTPAFSR